jgi:hypothetical protein
MLSRRFEPAHSRKYRLISLVRDLKLGAEALEVGNSISQEEPFLFICPGMRRSNVISTLVAAAMLVAPLAQLKAQVVQRPASEWYMELETSDRWMHGRQLARFTPFGRAETWLLVDSIRGDPDRRQIHLTLGRFASGRDSAVIEQDRNGRILRLTFGMAPYGGARPMYPGDSARFIESRRVNINDAFSLPESRVWDVVPTSPRGPLSVGARWSDTVAHKATDGLYEQSLTGERSSRVVGDTMANGRRLWIVRDSARVRYEERYLVRERTLDTKAQVSRTAEGYIRGVHWYDADLRLFRRREDTTTLAGEAVLRYPDGRTFRTPAHYERTRRWVLYDSAQYAARRADMRATLDRQMGGMVYVPENELQRRLSHGDTTLRDSLVRAWRQIPDPAEASRVFSALSMWSGRDQTFRARLDSLRIASGDTAFLYMRLSNRAYSRTPPTDTADVRAMLPFLEDPAIVWGFNLSRDWLYENLAQGLTAWPRAAAVGRDSQVVACTAAACRMLGDLRQSAREPRLRDVALIALFSTDPARWADSVLALESDHPLLRRAASLARGIGSTAPASAKAPMPPPNSDWHAWLHWMSGWDPRYAAAMQRLRVDSLAPSFGEEHRTALRMYMLRTGRNVIDELRRGYDAATSDTVRLVFGTMLRGMGELSLSEAQIAEAFTSGVPERATLGRGALVDQFGRLSTPMDTVAAAPLILRLLSVTIDSAPLWRVGAADMRQFSRRETPILHARARRVALTAANLPSSVRAKFGDRIQIITPQTPIDPRDALVIYTVTPVRAWGRFVRVEVSADERLARRPEQAPAHYAAATAYYLMELNGEWVIVAWESWVT